MKVNAWFKKYLTISQTVNTGVQYSLLSPEDKQCFPFVYCKEFVIDTTNSTMHKKPFSLYGMVYDPETDPPVCLDKVRIMIRNVTDREFMGRTEKLKKFLHLLEVKMGCDTFTEVEPVENPEKWSGPIVLLTSPAKWMHAPPMLSLYTLMVRAGLYYNGEDTAWEHCQKVRDGKLTTSQYKDRDYFKNAWKTIMDVVESGGARFHDNRDDNWPWFRDPWVMHDVSGIVSLANGGARKVSPGWYEEKKKDDNK